MLAQVERFSDELRFFVQMTGVEQSTQLEGGLPSIEQYLQRRMGSSAVGVCLAITEYSLHISLLRLLIHKRYCFNMQLPPSIMAEDDMRNIWTETNMIISTWVIFYSYVSRSLS